MALKNIIYSLCSYLPSCLHGKAELQVGERVKIALQPKNPLWPPSLIATVIAVEATYGGRNYTFQFDDAVLKSGPLFQGCDVISVAAYCCCDEMLDHVIAEANGDGTVTLHNFDGSGVCVVACPPDGIVEGYVPSIDADGKITWGPPSSMTYTLEGEARPFERLIQLNGGDGGDSTVSIPELHDGVPTPGSYAPDENGRVSIPVTKTDFSTNGVPVHAGDLVIDLSALAGAQPASFAYDPDANLYTLTLADGSELTAPGTGIDVSVPGEVTFTRQDGSRVTLPASDTNTSYDLTRTIANLGGDIAVTLTGSDGSADSIIIPTRYPYIPVGSYTASGSGRITLPILRMSSGGVVNNEGNIVLDLGSTGTGGGIASLSLVSDPGDPCSHALEWTDQSGTAHRIHGIAASNTLVLDPASGEHDVVVGASFTGYGLEGENPSANGDIYLPENGGEVRGTGPDFIKTISRKEDCSVLTRIAGGRRSSRTLVVDNRFYSDTPRYEREDHPFANAAAVPAEVMAAAGVWRFQGGSTGNITITGAERAALDFSGLHTLAAVSLSGGVFRSSGCPDYVTFSVTDGEFSGRLGNARADSAGSGFRGMNSFVSVVMGDLRTAEGYIGNAISLNACQGSVEFGTATTLGNPGPLRVNASFSLRLRGTEASADINANNPAVMVMNSFNVALDVEEISGGYSGIYVSASSGIVLRGRRVSAYSQGATRGRGVIEISGGNTADANDDCSIRFDQIVSVGERPAAVLSLLNQARVRAYDTLFVSEYSGTHDNVAVFFMNQSAGATPAIQLILHNCAAKVANVNTSLVKIVAVDVEIFIHGTFKTNSVNLSDYGTGSLSIMTGTLELGEPIA